MEDLFICRKLAGSHVADCHSVLVVVFKQEGKIGSSVWCPLTVMATIDNVLPNGTYPQFFEQYQ